MAKYLAKYTKEQLLEMAAPYWKANKDKMLASSDGQFFYTEGETYCDSHVRDNDLQKIILTKGEYLALKNKDKPKKAKQPEIVEPVKEEVSQIEKPKAKPQIKKQNKK